MTDIAGLPKRLALRAASAVGRRVTAGRDDERGAVLVISALVMSALLGICAIVIDLEQRRVTVRHQQSIADLSALAAGTMLASDPVSACRDAVTYFNQNIEDAAAIDAASFCTQSGNSVANTTCTGGALAEAMPQATTGRYTLSVHFPVPASEISDARLATRVNDGTQCQRLRVIVTVTNPAYFGRILGATTAVTTRSAVVKIDTRTPLYTPVLWLLDPTGCTALAASGGTTISVGTTSPTVIPGLITIDSDGTTCQANQPTISATGANTRIIAVPATGTEVGAISLRALGGAATTCSLPACDPADVTGGRLSPQPVPARQRATRSLVDWRYDCRSGYPDYHGIDIASCPDTTLPYISQLRAAMGTNGTPSGYQRWSDSYPCASLDPVVVVPAGNWHINCNELKIGNSSVTFLGGNVVTNGSISINGGSLAMNTANPQAALTSSCLTTVCADRSSATASFLYMRDGDFTMNGGTLDLRHTTLVQQTGYLSLTAGAVPRWSAPSEGPFAALSMWSELSSNKFQINGGAGMDLSGIFFTPEAAPFSISGGGAVAQLHAQFISFHLTVTGGGVLNMAPDPQAFIQIPPTAGVLIR